MFTFCSVGVCALTVTDLWDEGILQTLLQSRELRDAARLFFSNGARCIIMAVEVMFGCWQGGIVESCSSQVISVGCLILFGALNGNLRLISKTSFRKATWPSSMQGRQFLRTGRRGTVTSRPKETVLCDHPPGGGGGISALGAAKEGEACKGSPLLASQTVGAPVPVDGLMDNV